MDLKIDRDPNSPDFGDLVFKNATTPVTEDFTDSVAQRVYVMLRTFETEWYLNQTTGVPYLTEILGKKVDSNTVDRILQQKILEVQGVSDITGWASSVDDNRVYKCRMEIRDVRGDRFSETFSPNF